MHTRFCQSGWRTLYAPQVLNLGETQRFSGGPRTDGQGQQKKRALEIQLQSRLVLAERRRVQLPRSTK